MNVQATQEQRKAFRENLNYLMKIHDITPTILSEWLNLSRYAVHDYRKGKAMPKEETLEEICTIFRTTRKEILKGGKQCK